MSNNEQLTLAHMEAQVSIYELELASLRDVMKKFITHPSNNPGHKSQLTNVSIKFARLRTEAAAIREQILILKDADTPQTNKGIIQ
jgi:hypothetical protein